MALWSLSTQIHNIFTNYHATIPSNGRHNNSLFVLQIFTLYKASKNAILIGYFPFYEYAVIFRNYAIGILLLCSFCTLFKSWGRKFPITGLVLLLLAHTSVHALIIVISIVVLLLAEVLLTPDRPKKSKIGIGSALILTGIATAIFQIAPASDQGTNHSQTWMLNFEVRHLLDILNIMPTVFFRSHNQRYISGDLTA